MITMEHTAKYTAKQIAHWFIWRNKIAEDMEGGDPLSLLKLLKLMHYAEGSFLATERGSLFSNPIIAWRHGPVIKSLWDLYADEPYSLPVSDDEKQQLSLICKEDQDLLEDVFQTFGQLSAWKLRNMMLQETPWIKATNNGEIMNCEIKRELIKAYFKENYI